MWFRVRPTFIFLVSTNALEFIKVKKKNLFINFPLLIFERKNKWNPFFFIKRDSSYDERNANLLNQVGILWWVLSENSFVNINVLDNLYYSKCEPCEPKERMLNNVIVFFNKLSLIFLVFLKVIMLGYYGSTN